MFPIVCGRGPRLPKGRGDGCAEAVAFANYGFDEAWVFWVVAQGLPEFSDGGVDAMLGLNEDVLAPEFVDDLFACDEVAVPAGQQDQQLHGNFFEFQRPAVATQLIAAQIQLKSVKSVQKGGQENLEGNALSTSYSSHLCLTTSKFLGRR